MKPESLDLLQLRPCFEGSPEEVHNVRIAMVNCNAVVLQKFCRCPESLLGGLRRLATKVQRELCRSGSQVTISTSEFAGFTEVSVIFVPDFVKLPGA